MFCMSIDDAQLGGAAGAALLWSKINLDLEQLRGDKEWPKDKLKTSVLLLWLCCKMHAPALLIDSPPVLSGSRYARAVQ